MVSKGHLMGIMNYSYELRIVEAVGFMRSIETEGEKMKASRVYPLDKSYLHFNIQCLTFLGLWNPYQSGLSYWLYQVYWVYVIVVVMSMRIATGIARIVDSETAGDFFQEFSTVAVEISNAIAYFAFCVRHEDVKELCNAFNGERNVYGTYEITQFRNQSLTRAMAIARIFTIFLLSVPIQYFTILFYECVGRADHQVEKLLMGKAPMKYAFVTTNFWAALIYDYVSFTWFGLGSAAHYAFIMAITINLKAQLEIINFRMELCHKTTYDIGNEDKYENSVVMQFECAERPINAKSAILNPNEELINCIKLHQHIVSIMNLFKKIYSKAFLPQLVISLVLTTALLAGLILGKASSSTNRLITITFLIGDTFQLLTFCWGGNIILVESDKSSDSLYRSHWYERDREFQGNLKIFLGAIRNPLVVTAGGICELSAVTFKNILCKAYSAMTVLQNTNR